MTAQRPPAVISIWIPNQGPIKQGKFTYLNDRPFYIANMTRAKEFGTRPESRWPKSYAISRRLLVELPRGTTIVYQAPYLNSHYIASKTLFKSKGILVNFGGHSQLILPMSYWKPVQGLFDEGRKDLPVISLDRWLKESPERNHQETDVPTKPGDCLSQRLRMKELFNQATA